MGVLDRFDRYKREAQSEAQEKADRLEAMREFNRADSERTLKERRELDARNAEALVKKDQALKDRQVEFGPLERLVNKPEFQREGGEPPLRGVIRDEIQNPTPPRVQTPPVLRDSYPDRGVAVPMQPTPFWQADPSPGGGGYRPQGTAPVRNQATPERQSNEEPPRPPRLIDQIRQQSIMAEEKERRLVAAMTPEQRREHILAKKEADREADALLKQLENGRRREWDR